MPAAHVLAMMCTGHGCWVPRPNDQASGDVYVNGIALHRQGDHWAVHCCPEIPECHDSVLAHGSPTVFANARQAARRGDPVACGSFAADGSPNVFIGD